MCYYGTDESGVHYLDFQLREWSIEPSSKHTLG